MFVKCSQFTPNVVKANVASSNLVEFLTETCRINTDTIDTGRLNEEEELFEFLLSIFWGFSRWLNS